MDLYHTLMKLDTGLSGLFSVLLAQTTWGKDRIANAAWDTVLHQYCTQAVKPELHGQSKDPHAMLSRVRVSEQARVHVCRILMPCNL